MHDADAGEIFARGLVERILKPLDALKARKRAHDGNAQYRNKQHDRDARCQRPLPRLAGDLHYRPDGHERRLDDDLKRQNDQHLHLNNVVCRTGYKARGRKSVYLLESKALDLVEHFFSQTL